MANPSRQVALVTGATGAIGLAICSGLARAPGFEVVLLGRDEARTRRAAQQIRQETGNERVRFELADLSREKEIRALAQRWQDPLHVLVNNAGATPRRRQATPEGIELQFATNVLGYFWMVRAFREILIRSAPARVINVASNYAGDLDLDDLQFRRRPYDNRRAYRQSKQANRMLAAAFARRLAEHDVTVNACHPGDVNSRLSNDLGFGGSESPEQGARTPVWLATSETGGRETGCYYADQHAVRDPFMADEQAVETLYDICAGFSSRL